MIILKAGLLKQSLPQGDIFDYYTFFSNIKYICYYVNVIKSLCLIIEKGYAENEIFNIVSLEGC